MNDPTMAEKRGSSVTNRNVRLEGSFIFEEWCQSDRVICVEKIKTDGVKPSMNLCWANNNNRNQTNNCRLVWIAEICEFLTCRNCL